MIGVRLPRCERRSDRVRYGTRPAGILAAFWKRHVSAPLQKARSMHRRHALPIAAVALTALTLSVVIAPAAALAASPASGSWHWPTGTEDFGGRSGRWDYRAGNHSWHMAQDMPASRRPSSSGQHRRRGIRPEGAPLPHRLGEGGRRRARSAAEPGRRLVDGQGDRDPYLQGGKRVRADAARVGAACLHRMSGRLPVLPGAAADPTARAVRVIPDDPGSPAEGVTPGPTCCGPG